MSKRATSDALHTALNDLVHLAHVALESCRARERGAPAALAAYGAKHREIVAMFAKRDESA